MEKMRETPERIDPAPRLAMVLIRYSLGWFERSDLAAALSIAPSQVSMWERGRRPIPPEVLEETARLRGFSRTVLPQVLREIRSFLRVAEGGSRPGRAMDVAAAVDLLPLLREITDLILAPLAWTASARLPAGDPAETQELWTRLEQRTAAERLLIVEEGEEYQTLALHERVLAESAARAATEPRESRELAELAARIAGDLQRLV
jgi:transcriptional regulator with XRE-family HTH domain